MAETNISNAREQGEGNSGMETEAESPESSVVEFSAKRTREIERAKSRIQGDLKSLNEEQMSSFPSTPLALFESDDSTDFPYKLRLGRRDDGRNIFVHLVGYNDDDDPVFKLRCEGDPEDFYREWASVQKLSRTTTWKDPFGDVGTATIVQAVVRFYFAWAYRAGVFKKKENHDEAYFLEPIPERLRQASRAIIAAKKKAERDAEEASEAEEFSTESEEEGASSQTGEILAEPSSHNVSQSREQQSVQRREVGIAKHDTENVEETLAVNPAEETITREAHRERRQRLALSPLPGGNGYRNTLLNNPVADAGPPALNRKSSKVPQKEIKFTRPPSRRGRAPPQPILKTDSSKKKPLQNSRPRETAGSEYTRDYQTQWHDTFLPEGDFRNQDFSDTGDNSHNHLPERNDPGRGDMDYPQLHESRNKLNARPVTQRRPKSPQKHYEMPADVHQQSLSDSPPREFFQPRAPRMQNHGIPHIHPAAGGPRPHAPREFHHHQYRPSPSIVPVLLSIKEQIDWVASIALSDDEYNEYLNRGAYRGGNHYG